EQHHWYYRVAHDPAFREQQHVVMPSAEAAQQAAVLENRLRTLTEQLYLHSSMEDLAAVSAVSISNIQHALAEDTVLIEYYTDGAHLWAFVLDRQRLEVFTLAEPIATIEKRLDKWQNNINRALRTEPGSADAEILQGYARAIAQQLY